MSMASHSIRAADYDAAVGDERYDSYTSGIKDSSLSSYTSPAVPSATTASGMGLGDASYSAMPSLGKGGDYGATASPGTLAQPGLAQQVPGAARDVRDTAKSAYASLKDTAWSFGAPVMSLIAPMWNAAYAMLSWGLGLAGSYWRGLPALRAFTYSFAALTLIPNAMFLGFVGIAAAVVLGTALTISSLILAGVAGFGLLFLGPVLFFSFWGALIGVGIYQLAMYGLRASAVSLGATQQMTSPQGIVSGGIGMAKSAAAMAADTLEKVEGVAVGGDGLPAPLAGRV